MVISITNSGYIKSLPLSTYRQQRRGGIGVTGMDMKDDGLHRAPVRLLDGTTTSCSSPTAARSTG